MTEEKQPVTGGGAMGVGLFVRPDAEDGITSGDIIAALLSFLWLVMAGGFWFFVGRGTGTGGPLGSIMVMVAIALPVALIWVAAITLRTARQMRSESRRLQAAIDAMRHAYINQAQASVARPSMEKRLDEIAMATRQTETAVATFTSSRDGGPKPAKLVPAVAQTAPEEEQPTLAFGPEAGLTASPVPSADFIKALNFPDSPTDKDGFRALRAALEDHAMAKLIRAAQDTLTLLSQDGIYMDDLKPDRARPELWRRFAQGERGRPIAALGGVRDRSSLALTAGRMRQDTIFRDAAHHFLRQFDKTFAGFEKTATDQEIAALAETRTARAFMLLGRVAGIFD